MYILQIKDPLTENDLHITYLPTIVPIPRSLLVTKVPMMLVKNSGALVPTNCVSRKFRQ